MFNNYFKYITLELAIYYLGSKQRLLEALDDNIRLMTR